MLFCGSRIGLFGYVVVSLEVADGALEVAGVVERENKGLEMVHLVFAFVVPLGYFVKALIFAAVDPEGGALVVAGDFYVGLLAGIGAEVEGV